MGVNPTCKAKGGFVGLLKLVGLAVSGNPIIGRLSGQRSVWCSWSVEEQWKRQRTVIRTNKDGKKVESIVTDIGWSTIAGQTLSQRFYLQDESGVIRIDPAGAELKPATLFSKVCSTNDLDYYRLGPQCSIPGSTGLRRFKEKGIPAGKSIYVFGHSRIRKDSASLEMAAAPQKPLLIAAHSETVIADRYMFRELIYGLIFFFGTLVTLALFLCQTGASYLICAAIALLFLAAEECWECYKSVIELRNGLRQAKSNLDVELMRRHSLIGSLIEVVKGVRNYEKEINAILMLLRSQEQIRDSAEAAGKTELKGLVKQVAAAVENYPFLKSDPHFQKLQENLKDTEQRIALSRIFYNDRVKNVNNLSYLFPEFIIAQMVGLKEMEYLKAEDFETPSPEFD